MPSKFEKRMAKVEKAHITMVDAIVDECAEIAYREARAWGYSVDESRHISDSVRKAKRLFY